MSTIISECEDGYALLGAYFKAVGTELASSGPYADPSTLSSTLPFDQLLTFAYSGTTSQADFGLGYALNVISEFSAIQRELGMASMNKTQLLLAASSEAQEEATYLDQNSSYIVGVLKGASTSGTQC